MTALDVAVLVHNVDATGGMERQARALAGRLAERGARVRIVTNFWVDGVLPRWRPLERQGRLQITRIGLPRGWGYLPGLAFYELAATALLALRPPDVLYGIQWTGGVHALRVGRVLERRVAVKLACGGVHGDLRAIHEAQDPAAFATLRRADRIVCMTEQIESEARAEGFSPEQLARIPNGVDLEPFSGVRPARFSGSLALLETAERIVYVGALRAQKHLPSLIAALSLVRETRPRAHLLIAGEGEERGALEALARERGLEARVHFLGRRTDVAALLAAAHVFVLPSESEGLSNALLEALASGVPVVASAIEGNRAVVDDERDALLVRLDDVPGLARAIERILESPELAARLSRAGRERARAFSLDSVARRYERELRGLSRARPSSVRILERWATELEGPGITGLVRRGAAYSLGRSKQLLLERLDRTTIALKRALGFETGSPVSAPAPVPDRDGPGKTARARRRRLGVAVLVYNLDLTGGMERQALQLAEELARQGARVWLVSTTTVEGWRPRLPEGARWRERRGRLVIHRVPLCRAWLWTYCTELYELAVAALLATKARQLDAVYAVQWTAAVHAERATRVLDCPYFVKLAGGGANGDFAGIEREGAHRAAFVALARAEGIVCISPQIESEVVGAGLSAQKVLRIPNGVDLARFRETAAPRDLPGPADAERVLFVGALRREKRLPELVRAFATVARERPRARLVLAGDGPEEEAIRRTARDLGLEDRVDLLGRRADVPDLLASTAAFVLTSESEGLSNALLEAMAAGAPIVATDIEGNRAVVADGREALLVPLGDDAALAGALGRLLEDRALAARLSAAARAKAGSYEIGRVALEHASRFRRASRPLPGPVGLARRYLARWGGLGVSGLVLGVLRQRYVPVLRSAVSSVVVAIKRSLGIEGDILARPHVPR